MTHVPTWLLGIHEALQVIWRWSHQDAPALILWRLLLLMHRTRDGHHHCYGS